MNLSAARKAAYLLTALLGFVILLCLGAELFTLTLRIPKNYNEGWNAYHAMAALSAPFSLYPSAPSFLTNNYPPLSFVIVGAFSRLTGDAIIAGRILAFVSTLGIGICLGFCALSLGCRRREAIIAALTFWAAPWVIVRFSALNDPQMLGNVLDAIGLVIFLRAPRSLVHIAFAAFFLCLAEFIKPLYVTLPLALLLWLWLTARRSALLLAGFGLGFALIGYGLTWLVFHAELLAHIFSPRLFLWSKLTGQPGQWLVVMAIPFAASLALLRRRNDDAALFAGLYALLAFLLAIVFSGGDGVSASQMMDASMAVSLGGAVYLSRAGEKAVSFAGLGLAALTQSVMLVLAFLGLWASRPALPELMAAQGQTKDDIGLIAARPEPVLCETLAFCYWAQKPPQMDAFGFGQAVRRGRRDAGDLTRLLDARAFSLIQLQPRSYFAAEPFRDAIARNYVLHHQDPNGAFLTPRR